MACFKKIILLHILLLTNSVLAQELVLSSKNKQPVFIELFTSQGCSSCPPAEKYMNGFADNPQLWEKFIPLVFHVDYWDYIGWKDVFAQPGFAARQYRYAKLKSVRTVYTPAFIVNGLSWQRGFFASHPKVKGLNNGLLTVRVFRRKFEAKYHAKKSDETRLMMNLAILGMDMVINISAGENKGRKARHGFIVLGYVQQQSKNAVWKMDLPELKKHVAAKRYAIVAWVSRGEDPAPLQAVGGWFDGVNPD